MPFGRFASHADCVRQNQDKRDPDAYCAELERRIKQAGDEPEPEPPSKIAAVLAAIADFLRGTPARAVSVSTGGIDESTSVRIERDLQLELAVKDATPGTWEHVVRFFKADDERHVVYGLVYEPDMPDAHGDAMTAAEIRKAQERFMIRYATLSGETGTDHRKSAARSQLPVIESFLAPTTFQVGQQTIREGSWVMAAKVLDDALWKDVKGGKYTGWSFEGYGRRVAA